MLRLGVEFDICGDGESRLHQVIKPYLPFLPEYLQSLLLQFINSVCPAFPGFSFFFFASEPGISLKCPGLGLFIVGISSSHDSRGLVKGVRLLVYWCCREVSMQLSIGIHLALALCQP